MIDCICGSGKRFNKAFQEQRRNQNKVDLIIEQIRMMVKLKQQQRRQGQGRHQGSLSADRVQEEGIIFDPWLALPRAKLTKPARMVWFFLAWHSGATSFYHFGQLRPFRQF